MRTILQTIFLMILAWGLPITVLAGVSERPNIVVFFVDDMGYRHIGPFGSTYPTPHLDRMAEEGMKLTSFYVSSTACTPSRSALMTGCYANRIEMGRGVVYPGDDRGLNPSEVTIAELLKGVGYTTGCFGKWHLGDQPDFMPTKQGFDEYEGIPYSNDMWIKNKKWGNLAYIKGTKVVAHIPDRLSQAVLTDSISDATVDFINRHHDGPFFAYVPFAAVHNPKCVLKDRGEKAAALGLDKPDLAAQVMEIDACVGRVMATLRKHGIAENTLVFFTNDNGGGNRGHRDGFIALGGGKFGPKYEGHMRMATLAWWPGHVQAGSVCDEIGATIDLLPTFAKLAGAKVPTDRIIDGHDISDMLLGKEGAKSPHDVLYYENDGIRQGKWKLVRLYKRVEGKGKLTIHELYDLEKDLGETTDISKANPEKVEELKRLLDAHVARIKEGIRPAGYVENPKVILPDATGIPTLAEYRGEADKQVF